MTPSAFEPTGVVWHMVLQSTCSAARKDKICRPLCLMHASDVVGTTEECAKVEAELDGAKRAVAKKERDKKEIDRQIQNFRDDILQQKARARGQQAQAARLRAKKNPQRPVSRLPQLREQLDELSRELGNAQDEKEKLLPKDAESSQQHFQASERVKRAQSEVAKCEEEFKRLENIQGGNLARFGADVPQIAAAFKAAERQFPPGKAPIGPVGAFIKLKDPKWALALCDTTSRGGQTWLVHSYKDIELCKKILRQRRISENSALFHTLNPDEFEVKIGSAPEPTVLDIVEIDHPDNDCRRFIRNLLVDRFNLNEIRIAPDFQSAKNVAERPSERIKLSNGVTHELKRICYSLNNSQTAVERKQEGLRGGSGVKSSFVYSRVNPYVVDVSARKAQIQHQLAAAREECTKQTGLLHVIAAEKRTMSNQIAALQRKESEVDAQVRRVEAQISKEEEEQAKWQDADENDQDDEIRALEDISGFEEVGPCSYGSLLSRPSVPFLRKTLPHLGAISWLCE